MTLTDINSLANELFTKHGLADWVFKFDNAKRRFGCCNYTTKTISLSKHLCRLNSESEIVDTLLHEIAHALTPGQGHGKLWQEKCAELGAEPRRCYSADQVKQPPPNYYLYCAACDFKQGLYRMTRRKYLCPTCTNKSASGLDPVILTLLRA